MKPDRRRFIVYSTTWQWTNIGTENIDIEPQDTGEDAGILLGKLGETAASEFREKLGPILDARFTGIKEDPLMEDLRQLAEEHILQNPAAWDFVQVEETK